MPENKTPIAPAPTEALRELDAARYVGLSGAYLRQARREERGPAYYRIGRAVRYLIADLDAWRAQYRVSGQSTPRAAKTR